MRMAARMLRNPVATLTTLGFGSSVLSSMLYTVDGGERALIYDRLRGGTQPGVHGEGTHFLVPFVQTPVIYEVRTRPFEVSSTTGSKDLQQVQVTLRLLYRPKESKLQRIYQEYGRDYDSRVLPSISNEVLKAVVAHFDAGELITQRATVSNDVRRLLTERALEFDIELDDVSITELGFTSEYMHAIEQKQVAQQDAERSRWLVETERQLALAAVTKAEGEAEAAGLIAEAMKSGTGFLDLRRVEAAKEIAETLARSPNVTYLPNDSNILMQMAK